MSFIKVVKVKHIKSGKEQIYYGRLSAESAIKQSEDKNLKNYLFFNEMVWS